jgi:2-C-methyl-D-erythritol 4-phosphate cytidylyltransferase
VASGDNRFALIVAGGKGLRMGSQTPKQFAEIQGRQILARTIDAFLDADIAERIFVVFHPEFLHQAGAWLEENFSGEKLSKIQTTGGGKERIHSVHNGLQAIQAYCKREKILNPWVAIHDGVRPFVSKRLLQAAFTTATEKGNAVVAVPVKSSMRILEPGGNSRAIDRSVFFHVQTPQIFRLDEILLCYENRPGDNFTDDASIAEVQGVKIFLSEGSYDNIKITTREDLAQAEVIIRH